MIFAFKHLKEMLNPKSPIRRQHHYPLDLRGLIWLKKKKILFLTRALYITFCFTIKRLF